MCIVHPQGLVNQVNYFDRTCRLLRGYFHFVLFLFSYVCRLSTPDHPLQRGYSTIELSVLSSNINRPKSCRKFCGRFPSRDRFLCRFDSTAPIPPTHIIYKVVCPMALQGFTEKMEAPPGVKPGIFYPCETDGLTSSPRAILLKNSYTLPHYSNTSRKILKKLIPFVKSEDRRDFCLRLGNYSRPTPSTNGFDSIGIPSLESESR